MRKKATRHQLKNHNSELVLQTIFGHGPISRADIARATKLTRPTVSTLVSDLLTAGLIVEIGTGPSAGGKRPTLLEVDPDATHVAALDIGNQLFRGALVNLRGDIKARVEQTAVQQTGAAAVERLFATLSQLLNNVTAPVLGIAVGTPGITDADNGIIYEAVNLGWHNLPLRQLIEAKYSTPVYLSNDSHAAAYGEYKFGQPRDSDNLILIKTGRGIGAGIILQGRPFYGDNFGAGEIGQLVVSEQAAAPQNLEAVASTQALLQQAQAAAGESLTWAELVTAVQQQDPTLTPLFNQAATHLGTAVGTLIAAYNIRHIIFSGRFTQFGQPFCDIVFNTARQRVLPALANQTAFACSNLGEDIVLLGCAALVVREELGIL